MIMGLWESENNKTNLRRFRRTNNQSPRHRGGSFAARDASRSAQKVKRGTGGRWTVAKKRLSVAVEVASCTYI